jgi:hypothetical protein
MPKVLHIAWPTPARPGPAGDGCVFGAATSRKDVWLWRLLPLAVSLAVHVLAVAVAAVTLIVAHSAGRDLEPLPAALLSLDAPLPVVAPAQEPPTNLPDAAAPQRPAMPTVQEIMHRMPLAPSAALAGPILRPAGDTKLAVPVSRFFGVGSPADQVVFVIDCSGSMLESFDEVRREVLVSISRLRDDQGFHVILFAGGKAHPGPLGGLAPPTRANKLRTADFLAEALPRMSSDPLPALEAAFEAMEAAPAGQKLIYLLTDGVFPDNEKVLQTLRRLNRHGDVAMNTYLYTEREGPAAAVMKRIALENRGQFKIIRPRE